MYYFELAMLVHVVMPTKRVGMIFTSFPTPFPITVFIKLYFFISSLFTFKSSIFSFAMDAKLLLRYFADAFIVFRMTSGSKMLHL